VSDEVLTEEVLQFGEDARLFGILTLPRAPKLQEKKLPVVVFLSSGFMHRVGPRRLYVRLARTLAEIGLSSFRVDLSGRGESPGRPELRDEQSLRADYKEIVSVLEGRLGPSQFVLAGLCSGADNAVTLAQTDQRVVGLLLMDPTCYPDAGFRRRQFFRKYTHISRYAEWLTRKLALLAGRRESPRPYDNDLYSSPLVIGVLPTLEQIRAAFQAICERKGRALSIFTSLAEDLDLYNQVGQLGRVLGLPDYEQYCSERFFTTASHTFELEMHRGQLVHEIKEWARGYLSPQITALDDQQQPIALTNSIAPDFSWRATS
jgi:hypothetical protein